MNDERTEENGTCKRTDTSLTLVAPHSISLSYLSSSFLRFLLVTMLAGSRRASYRLSHFLIFSHKNAERSADRRPTMEDAEMKDAKPAAAASSTGDDEESDLEIEGER